MRHIRDGLDDLYAAMGFEFTVVPAISEKEIKALSKCVSGRAILAVLSARRGGIQLVFHEVLKLLGMDRKGIYAHTFKAVLAYIHQQSQLFDIPILSSVSFFARPSDVNQIVTQVKRHLEWEELRRKAREKFKPKPVAESGVFYARNRQSHVTQRPRKGR